jgi:hypothetical protein
MLSLYLINPAPHYEGIRNGSIAPPFLTLALDGGEWSASCSCHFPPSATAPSTQWIGGWEGPRASLDAMEKRKISSLLRTEP